MTFSTALSLADEYGIKLWIAALLDPEPITHGTSDPKKSIQSPPTFSMKDPVNGLEDHPRSLTAVAPLAVAACAPPPNEEGRIHPQVRHTSQAA